MLDKIGILNVPDLHLYDMEIGQSRGYFEQSVKILDDIIALYQLDETLDLVKFGGDIQHHVLTKQFAITAFDIRFKTLGILIKDRVMKKGLLKRIRAFDKEDKEIDLATKMFLNFSLEGNHDRSTKNPHTYFTHLVEMEYIIKPKIVMVDDIQFNFIHYTKNPDEMRYPKRPESKGVIALHHTNVVESGYNTQDHIGHRIDAGEFEVFAGVDLAIMYHIHDPWGIREFQTTTIITTGSLGRTSSADKHMRDYGNLVRIDVNGEDVQYVMFPLTLVPKEEFFDIVKILKIKAMNSDIEDFKLDIAEKSVDSFDPISAVESLEIPDKVKEKCLNALRGVSA